MWCMRHQALLWCRRTLPSEAPVNVPTCTGVYLVEGLHNAKIQEQSRERHIAKAGWMIRASLARASSMGTNSPVTQCKLSTVRLSQLQSHAGMAWSSEEHTTSTCLYTSWSACLYSYVACDCNVQNSDAGSPSRRPIKPPCVWHCSNLQQHVMSLQALETGLGSTLYSLPLLRN